MEENVRELHIKENFEQINSLKIEENYGKRIVYNNVWYNGIIYIYFSTTINIENQKNGKYYIYNGYEYKKTSKNEKSTFIKRNLGYEKRFSKTTSQKELDNGLKEEYCNAVKEIKKVDQKIVPGTNIPFKKATEAQIEDAYKEYLQRIAQIRQIVSIISPDDLNNNIYFETRINCYYKGTYWNNANKKYLARDFYSIEVNDYYK